MTATGGSLGGTGLRALSEVRRQEPSRVGDADDDAECYAPPRMTAHPNLADPDFEPTDEQLQELSRAAFAHLGVARRESDEKLRREIAELREQVLRSLKLPLKTNP